MRNHKSLSDPNLQNLKALIMFSKITYVDNVF